MRKTNLVFLFNQKNQILLGMKKRGFWMNKRNWFGGKCETWETVVESAIRELKEESGIDLMMKDLEIWGVINFFFLDKPEWNQECHIFSWKYIGSFQETEEMFPKRRNIDEIPYEYMREDDPLWLPKLIMWEKFNMTFSFDDEGNLIP